MIAASIVHCIGTTAVALYITYIFKHFNRCIMAQVCNMHCLILCKLQRDDFFTVCTRSSVIGLRGDSIYAFSFCHLNFRTACTSCKQLAGCIAVTRDGNRHGEGVIGSRIVACSLHFLGDEHTALALLRIGGDHIGKGIVCNDSLVSIVLIGVKVIVDHNIKVTGGCFRNGILCILRHTDHIGSLILRKGHSKGLGSGIPCDTGGNRITVACHDRGGKTVPVKHNTKYIAISRLCKATGNALCQGEALSGIDGQLAVVAQPDDQITYVLIVGIVFWSIGIRCCIGSVLRLRFRHMVQAVDTPGIQAKAGCNIRVSNVLRISICLCNFCADRITDIRRGDKIATCVFTVDINLIHIIIEAHIRRHLNPISIPQVGSGFAGTAGGRPVEADKSIDLFRIRYAVQYIFQCQQLQIILIGVLVSLVVCIGSVTLIPEDTVFILFPINIRHAIFLFCGLINREIGLVIVVTVFQRGGSRDMGITIAKSTRSNSPRSIGCLQAKLIGIEADISAAVHMFGVRQVGTGNTGDHNSTIRGKDILGQTYGIVHPDGLCGCGGIGNIAVLIGNYRLQQGQGCFLDIDPQLLLAHRCLITGWGLGISLDQFDLDGIPEAIGFAVNRIGDHIAFTAHEVLSGSGNPLDIRGNIRFHRGGSSLGNSILVVIQSNRQHVLQFHVLANGINIGKGCLCNTAGTGNITVGNGVEDIRATLYLFQNGLKCFCQRTGRALHIKVLIRIIDVGNHICLGCISRNLVECPSAIVVSNIICRGAFCPSLIITIGSFYSAAAAGIKVYRGFHNSMSQAALIQVNTDGIHSGIHAIKVLNTGLLVSRIQDSTKDDLRAATAGNVAETRIFPMGLVSTVCLTVGKDNDNRSTTGFILRSAQHFHTGVDACLNIGAVATILVKISLIRSNKNPSAAKGHIHIGVLIQRSQNITGSIISNDTNPIDPIIQFRNQGIRSLYNMLHTGLVTFHTGHRIGGINNQHNIPRCACGHRSCSADCSCRTQRRISHDKLLGLFGTLILYCESIQCNRICRKNRLVRPDTASVPVAVFVCSQHFLVRHCCAGIRNTRVTIHRLRCHREQVCWQQCE